MSEILESSGNLGCLGSLPKDSGNFVRRGEGNPRLLQRDSPACSNPQRAVAGAGETSSQGLELIMARFDRLESRWEATDRSVTRLQASKAAYRPQWRRHAYEKQKQTHTYRQQHEPVAAHIDPLNQFGDSRPQHQSNPTPVFEHSPYTCTLSDAALQNPDAEYHLVSCEEMHLGVEGDSQVLNQVDLQLNEMKLVDEEVRAIEVDKIDDNDGLHDSSKIATFDFDGCLTKTSVKEVNADTWSLVSPSIPEKLHNRYKDELHDAREDTVNGLKDMSIYSRMGVKRMGELDNKPFMLRS
ncbi:hypothetical protein SASPL_151884 [Salvia splendens]|uniref:Uncharacterized protein n=1 Tax=Salvia splendens TaxID=180675 RepID=A0A8X8YZH5_SALSN|nr:hypothetical protein SASPL_151884 [Salvia splendens]